jgi:hypothetical protein
VDAKGGIKIVWASTGLSEKVVGDVTRGEKRCVNSNRKVAESVRGIMRTPTTTWQPSSSANIPRSQAFSQQGDGQIADSPQDWQRHHGGELALFIARTPVAHVDGDAHHVFADERVEMVSLLP